MARLPGPEALGGYGHSFPQYGPTTGGFAYAREASSRLTPNRCPCSNPTAGNRSKFATYPRPVYYYYGR